MISPELLPSAKLPICWDHSCSTLKALRLHDRIERYKLYPTAYDRKLYCDLVDLDWDGLRKRYPGDFYKNGKALDSAELLLRAWSFLRTEAEEFISADDEDTRAARLNALSAALLEDFQVIVITLDEHDDAQVIFETLNAGGEPLAAMDLVRNDVFHRAVRRRRECRSTDGKSLEGI